MSEPVLRAWDPSESKLEKCELAIITATVSSIAVTVDPRYSDTAWLSSFQLIEITPCIRWHFTSSLNDFNYGSCGWRVLIRMLLNHSSVRLRCKFRNSIFQNTSHWLFLKITFNELWSSAALSKDRLQFAPNPENHLLLQICIKYSRMDELKDFETMNYREDETSSSIYFYDSK